MKIYQIKSYHVSTVCTSSTISTWASFREPLDLNSFRHLSDNQCSALPKTISFSSMSLISQHSSDTELIPFAACLATSCVLISSSGLTTMIGKIFVSPFFSKTVRRSWEATGKSNSARINQSAALREHSFFRSPSF